MNIIDSSCWLEYFAGTEAGEWVSGAVEALDNLYVPTITLFEVFKKLLIEKDEDSALLAVAHMKQGKTIELDAHLAISAARIGRELGLPLADSIIYASALKFHCQLWTQDKHFQGLAGVNYLEKRNP